MRPPAICAPTCTGQHCCGLTRCGCCRSLEYIKGDGGRPKTPSKNVQKCSASFLRVPPCCYLFVGTSKIQVSMEQGGFGGVRAGRGCHKELQERGETPTAPGGCRGLPADTCLGLLEGKKYVSPYVRLRVSGLLMLLGEIVLVASKRGWTFCTADLLRKCISYIRSFLVLACHFLSHLLFPF